MEKRERWGRERGGEIWRISHIGVGADKILVKDGVMFLSNKVNRNFAASSACIADSFRHDVCVCALDRNPSNAGEAPFLLSLAKILVKDPSPF